MNNEYFVIWMAGFYEGEGYCVNDISNNNRIRLGIDQNDPTPLYKAQKIWGGSVTKRTRVSNKGKICNGNTWRLCHNDALKFIDENPNTLLVVTADHETGGLGITSNNIKKLNSKVRFSTKGHTASMVPVFAKGVGSSEFSGIYDNTEIFKKMMLQIN